MRKLLLALALIILPVAAPIVVRANGFFEALPGTIAFIIRYSTLHSSVCIVIYAKRVYGGDAGNRKNRKYEYLKCFHF